MLALFFAHGIEFLNGLVGAAKDHHFESFIRNNSTASEGAGYPHQCIQVRLASEFVFGGRLAECIHVCCDHRAIELQCACASAFEAESEVHMSTDHLLF